MIKLVRIFFVSLSILRSSAGMESSLRIALKQHYRDHIYGIINETDISRRRRCGMVSHAKICEIDGRAAAFQVSLMSRSKPRLPQIDGNCIGLDHVYLFLGILSIMLIREYKAYR